MAAMDRAARDKKYLFAFFWIRDDEQTVAMRKVFDQATQKLTDRAETVVVRVTDAAENGIVEKFGLARAPLPLVLAIAPNGGVMGGFPREFTEQDLLNAFASPSTEKCMKALQDGKLVFLCVQNGSTKSNDEALKGVNEFTADTRYASATEVVMVDPSDSAEVSFLGDLKIDPSTTIAVTAFLAPPGVAIAEFEGETRKDELVAVLRKGKYRLWPWRLRPRWLRSQIVFGVENLPLRRDRLTEESGSTPVNGGR